MEEIRSNNRAQQKNLGKVERERAVRDAYLKLLVKKRKRTQLPS
jgi:hypothetical protein